MVILLFVLPLLYSTFCGPLFAASANPDANVSRLIVNVADFDGGLIGTAFRSFISTYSPGVSIIVNNGASAVTIPGMTFVDSSVWTPERMRSSVIDASAYASIYVNAGASASLMNALSSPTLAATYDPSSAITIIWDESRNSPVTTGRIGGLLKGLTGAFVEGFSANILATQLPLAASSPLINTPQLYARLLAVPIFYSEESLFPQTAPAINIAAAVGQILLVVFSLVTCNIVFMPLAPLSLHFSPGFPRAFARLAIFATFAAFLAAAFTTILIGVSRNWNTTMLQPVYAPGVTYGAIHANGIFDGNRWAQIWAIQWLQCLVFALWLSLPCILGKVQLAATLLAPMIIFNALSVNIDIADAGFQFFYYAPFWHTSEVMRFVLFGSLSTRVGMHVGVLVGWLVIELILFIAAHLKMAQTTTPSPDDDISSVSQPSETIEASSEKNDSTVSV